MTGNRGQEISPLRLHLDRVARRWWLVLGIMLIAGLGTTLNSMSQHPVHTGTKALRVVSATRGPEQDAVLAQGYVEYFNQPTVKQVLRAKIGLPTSVQFSARNSAASPIFYIDATAPTDDLAAGSADRLTDTFRDDINTQVRQGDQRTIADLRAQIAALQDRLRTLPSISNEYTLILEEITSLRKSINELNASTTNQLADVLPTAGVSTTSPSVVKNAALALIGGLILGIAAASVLASADDRRVTPHEIRTPRPTLEPWEMDRHPAGNGVNGRNGVSAANVTDGEDSRA